MLVQITSLDEVDQVAFEFISFVIFHNVQDYVVVSYQHFGFLIGLLYR